MTLETVIDELTTPTLPASLPSLILESDTFFRTSLPLSYERICDCKPNHLNCLTAKEWIKSQLGVWQFNYERRDMSGQESPSGDIPDFAGPAGNRACLPMKGSWCWIPS